MATELRFQVPVLRRNMAAMLALADTTINTVRRIASELRPSVLDDLGLVVAIKMASAAVPGSNWDNVRLPMVRAGRAFKAPTD